jgi:hypothetical protein
LRNEDNSRRVRRGAVFWWAVGCLGSFQPSTALGFSFNYKLITSETCYKSRKSAKMVKPIFFQSRQQYVVPVKKLYTLRITPDKNLSLLGFKLLRKQ